MLTEPINCGLDIYTSQYQVFIQLISSLNTFLGGFFSWGVEGKQKIVEVQHYPYSPSLTTCELP